MDLQDFIAEITGETADDDTVTVYRGHPNATYRLKPTIFRTAHIYLTQQASTDK